MNRNKFFKLLATGSLGRASVEDIHLECSKELVMEGIRFLDLMRTNQRIERDRPVRNLNDINAPLLVTGG